MSAPPLPPPRAFERTPAERFADLFGRQFGRMAALLDKRAPGCGEDLAAAAFAKAWPHFQRKDFATDSDAAAWLMRIGLNLAIDRARMVRPHVSIDKLNGTGDDLTNLLTDPRPEPAEVAERRDRVTAIERALHLLTPPQRQAVLQHYLSGKTMGVRDRARVYRGLQAMRQDRALREAVA